MQKLLLKLLLQIREKQRQSAPSGFTLTELLVVVIIGGLIVSSLMALVVQLVATEQRESARTETQREMQLALNYITSDLREAVYVYDGSEDHPINTVAGQPSYLEYLPREFKDNTDTYYPVLAFWKPEAIDPEAEGLPGYQDDGCNNRFGGDDRDTSSRRAECNNLWLQRRAYSLVVYFHQVNEPNDPKWEGQSRIVRYELPKYSDVGNLTRSNGFVDPGEIGAGGFQTWPYVGSADDNTLCNQPGGGGDDDPCPRRPLAGIPNQPTPGNIATLVDYVDLPDIDRPGEPDQCPALYSATPSRLLDNNRTPGFFACIRDVDGNIGVAQDIRIYLRGNANGRGSSGDSLSSTLESRLTMRGTIDRTVDN